MNPGAWTHYSYAIHDALQLVTCPIAEVHLSDIASREEWRRRLGGLLAGGLHRSRAREPQGYLEAVRRLTELVQGEPAGV